MVRKGGDDGGGGSTKVREKGVELRFEEDGGAALEAAAAAGGAAAQARAVAAGKDEEAAKAAGATAAASVASLKVPGHTHSVSGKGRNHFGEFSLVGSCNARTGALRVSSRCLRRCLHDCRCCRLCCFRRRRCCCCCCCCCCCSPLSTRLMHPMCWLLLPPQLPPSLVRQGVHWCLVDGQRG